MNNYNLDNLQLLEPIEFEHLVKGLLIQMGFNAMTTKASGDGGVDIFATNEQPMISGKYVIQCKRYASGNNVGEPTIRELYGVIHAENANKGILITTSDFSRQAVAFAHDKAIELINGDVLSTLLNKHMAGLDESASSYVAKKEAEKYIAFIEQFEKECDFLLKKEVFSIRNDIRNISPTKYHKFLKTSDNLTSNDIANGLKSPTVMDEFRDINEYFTDLFLIFSVPLKSINERLRQSGHDVKDPENEFEEFLIKWHVYFKAEQDTIVKMSFIDDYINKTLKVYREFKKVSPQEHPTLLQHNISQAEIHNTYVLQLEAIFRGLKAAKELMKVESPLLLKLLSDIVNQFLKRGDG